MRLSWDNRGMSDDSRPLRFGPPRVTLFAVLILFMCTVPMAFSARPFMVLLLVPLACLVYVLRARVVLSRSGVEVCNGLGVRRVGWPDVDGFTVPRRGPIRLLIKETRALALTAVPRNESGRLLDAARAVSPSA